MTKEALKLALEALEGVLDDAPKVLNASISGGLYEVVQCREAIIAIKEALRENAMREVQRLGQEIEQEPCDMGEMCLGCSPRKADGSCPDAKPWVGLTDEEIAQGCKESWVTEQAFQSAVWWAEAKLKEKNNAA